MKYKNLLHQLLMITILTILFFKNFSLFFREFLQHRRAFHMTKVISCIVNEHDLWLIVMSVFICLLASQTAFSLHYRGMEPSRPRGSAWLLAAAVAMGSGVWATHFVAILAYDTPWTIRYDAPITILSALIPIAVSAIGLWMAKRGFWILGGAVVGASIGAMHFTGMQALRGPFHLEWDLNYVIASIVVGIAFSLLAFYLVPRHPGRIGKAMVVAAFSLATCGLHFTAMAAVTMPYDPLNAFTGTPLLSRQSLAIIVAATTIILLATGMLCAYLDGYLADRSAQEAGRLRSYVKELEKTKRELQDTTKELSQALKVASASSQAKSQFLATMSHELRTPLNAIIGFSELLKAQTLGPVGNPRYLEYAADINQSGNHLLSLINDVLDFSKVEAGRLVLDEELVDVGDLLRDCVRLMSQKAIEAEIEISTDLPPEAILATLDHQRMKQIALNLLSNALKFTLSGGKLEITLTRCDDGLAIVFSDNGAGMSPEQIPLALETFGQVDSGLNRKQEGTGLGLPLCRLLTEAHGGRLEIESVPDQGTSVTVHIPAQRVRPPENAFSELQLLARA